MLSGNLALFLPEPCNLFSNYKTEVETQTLSGFKLWGLREDNEI